MPTVKESLGAKTEIGVALALGVDTIDLSQEITFTQYTKVVLPLDGFIFWVKSELLSPSALYNAAMFNAVAFNAAPVIVQAAPTLVARGSLHYETTKQQDEDQTVGVNTVILTSEQEIIDFNAVGPNTTYIATVGPDQVRYTFSRRQSFYRQAGLFHYVGTALLPAMATQIIDDVVQFDQTQPVVSNSLPLWLALNSYMPLPGSLGCPLQLYPSYAVLDNLEPPYGVVHINPEGTEALQGAPYLDATLSHFQLAQDQVRVTLYGLRNFNAMTFIDAVNDYSLNTDNIGMMNMPIVRDAKRTQVEFNILAMKKTIDYTISYYQATARTIARQLIESAIPSYIVMDL
jgi:hypothetical protein